MQAIYLNHYWGEHLVFRESAEYRVFGLTSNHLEESRGFPDLILLGDLGSLILHKISKNDQGIERKIPEFSSYLPLSYLDLPAGLRQELDTLTSLEMREAPSGLKSDSAHFFHVELLYSLLLEHCRLTDKDIELQIKSLFQLNMLSDMIGFEKGRVSLGLSRRATPIFVQLIEDLMERRRDLFSSGQLLFTNRDLKKAGVVFQEGCFYDRTGYGCHVFYLYDLKMAFFILSTRGFLTAWYIFLNLLNDLEYFDNLQEGYLMSLEEEISLFEGCQVGLQGGEI